MSAASAAAMAMMGNGAGPFNQSSMQSAYFNDTTEEPVANVDAGATPAMTASEAAPAQGGFMDQPAAWWVGLVVVTAIFVFISRKFGGPEKFGNLKLTAWNSIFSVAWIIIVLAFMKVLFAYVRVPGWSKLVAMV